jgi:hypothetical protein
MQYVDRHYKVKSVIGEGEKMAVVYAFWDLCGMDGLNIHTKNFPGRVSLHQSSLNRTLIAADIQNFPVIQNMHIQVLQNCRPIMAVQRALEK